MVNISTLSSVSVLPSPANIPLVGLEVAPVVFLTAVKSPKSCASTPCDAIVIKSMIFELLGVSPPPNNALVEFEHAMRPFLATVKLPKSVAFPVVEMVTKSITSETSPPPPNTPRVDDAAPAVVVLIVLVSPKSFALPVDAMVTYSIVFTAENDGPF